MLPQVILNIIISYLPILYCQKCIVKYIGTSYYIYQSELYYKTDFQPIFPNENNTIVKTKKLKVCQTCHDNFNQKTKCNIL